MKDAKDTTQSQEAQKFLDQLEKATPKQAAQSLVAKIMEALRDSSK